LRVEIEYGVPIFQHLGGDLRSGIVDDDQRDRTSSAGDAILAAAATQIDSDPFDRADTAQLVARRVRAVVEQAADEVITRTGRALGPGPLCQDGRHAQRVADLAIYIRQSHAERDLAELGRLAGRRC